MTDPFPCPRCRTALHPIGEAAIDGQTFPVYQCDVCTELWDIGGESFDAAYTFAVGADGRAFDPNVDLSLN